MGKESHERVSPMCQPRTRNPVAEAGQAIDRSLRALTLLDHSEFLQGHWMLRVVDVAHEVFGCDRQGERWRRVRKEPRVNGQHINSSNTRRPASPDHEESEEEACQISGQLHRAGERSTARGHGKKGSAREKRSYQTPRGHQTGQPHPPHGPTVPQREVPPWYALSALGSPAALPSRWGWGGQQTAGDQWA